MCGYLFGGDSSKKSKALFYELVGTELLFYKKKDKALFLGRKELAGVTPTLNKEGNLVLRDGHDGSFVLRSDKAAGSSSCQEWLDTIVRMQTEHRQKLEAQALRDASDESKIPEFFMLAIATLKRRALSIEGVFRISADKDSVAAMLSQWQKSVSSVDWDKMDVHLLACSLKKYVREMPVPLLTFDMYNDFIAVGRELNGVMRVGRLRELLERLPVAFKKMLFELMDLVNAQHQNRAKNLMSSKNLSVVFSPSILRSRNETTLVKKKKKPTMENFVFFSYSFN